MTRSGLSIEEDEERLRLYRQGLNDREIGEEVGRTARAIAAWRNKLGLEPNGGGGLSETEEEVRLRLYNQGLSDSAIAEEVGTTRPAITAWRKSRNLPPHTHHKPEEQGAADRAAAERVEATIEERSDEVFGNLFDEGGEA